MADRFYGINKGLDQTTVTDGAATTSKAIELRVNDTVTERQQVIDGVRNILNYLLQTNFPPQ